MGRQPLNIPPIRFADSRSGRLAYQVFGEGPPIVAIPPTAQHIEMGWEWPDIRSMLEQFASFSRYLHFDKRGTGASDRKSRVPGIDERVEDLRAVMDAAEFDRAHFFACSEGGPMAILFAATYPERVESLIFHGAWAARLPAGAHPADIDERRRRHRELARGWGTPDSWIVPAFAPSKADDSEFRTWHQRYERSAADSDSLFDLLELSAEMDVREVLSQLNVPALVLHRTGDRIVPVELGRELAEAIPGARIVELAGEDHFQYIGDVNLWMDEVERFVTGRISERPSPSATRNVEIHTLGRFAVLRDGTEVPVSEWGSRIARQICKRLVAARGRPVTREELIDMVWPEETDMAKLGARLSVQLSAVRRILGGGVVADRSSVCLDLNHLSTDLEKFFDARDHHAIVASYQGGFLPEDVYEDWTGPVRDEVRTRFVTSARQLARRLSEEGQHDRVLQLARRILQEDRYDEGAHRLLVDTLWAMGEEGEAKRAREVWTKTMADIGVEIASPPGIAEVSKGFLKKAPQD